MKRQRDGRFGHLRPHSLQPPELPAGLSRLGSWLTACRVCGCTCACPQPSPRPVWLLTRQCWWRLRGHTVQVGKAGATGLAFDGQVLMGKNKYRVNHGFPGPLALSWELCVLHNLSPQPVRRQPRGRGQGPRGGSPRPRPPAPCPTLPLLCLVRSQPAAREVFCFSLFGRHAT